MYNTALDVQDAQDDEEAELILRAQGDKEARAKKCKALNSRKSTVRRNDISYNSVLLTCSRSLFAIVAGFASLLGLVVTSYSSTC